MVKNTTVTRACKATDCEIVVSAYGLCKKHQSRYEKYGCYEYKTKYDKRPAVVDGDIAYIPLGFNASKGYATIDKDDKEKADMYNWYLGSDGYVHTKQYKKGRTKSLHTYLMPSDGKNVQIDHINRDKLDNRRENLRYCTQSDNLKNKGVYRNNRTGFTGVARSSRLVNPYTVQISNDNEQIYLGVYSNKYEAALVYDCAALQLHGEFAKTNIL